MHGVFRRCVRVHLVRGLGERFDGPDLAVVGEQLVVLADALRRVGKQQRVGQLQAVLLQGLAVYIELRAVDIFRVRAVRVIVREDVIRLGLEYCISGIFARAGSTPTTLSRTL